VKYSGIRYLILAAAIAVVLSASPVHAGPAVFAGYTFENQYIERDGRILVDLAEVAGCLGCNLINDADRILIGGTIHGAITLEPGSSTVVAGPLEIDFSSPLVSENDRWYAHEEFLKSVLGVKMVLDPESGTLVMYPEVVAISPGENVIRITSSDDLEFQAYEYPDPARRIIDIENAYVDCGSLNVTGSDVGIDTIRELRLSQFSIDPPVVRIVLEWLNESAPAHSLFPQGKSLSICVGNSSDITQTGPVNLLDYAQQDAEPVDEPESETSIRTESGGLADRSGADRDEQEISITQDNDGPLGPDVSDEQNQSSEQETDDRDSLLSDQLPVGNPVEPPEVEIPPGITVPVFDPVELPEPVEPPDPLPDNADDFDEGPSLEEQGWEVSYDTDDDGGIISVLKTKPFESLHDFTLAGDGMRLVLDLTGSILEGRGEKRVDGYEAIAQVRFGQFEENVTRVVFDLDRVFAYELEYDGEEGEIRLKLLHGDLVDRLIVIDAGHGGEDPGAVVRCVQEKDLNLEMAFFLREFLEEQGATIVLTRENDRYITLADRVGQAAQIEADLFICIHNNATEETTPVQGSLILWRDERYMPLYRLVHRGIAARTGVPGLGVVEDERGLYILRHAGDMPVVFVEAAFMTNPIDLARLTDRSRAYSRNIMLGVMDGVSAYYAGRDLPPVQYPTNVEAVESGIFDLVGQPIISSEDLPDDSGSAWDNPDTVSDEETDDESSDSDDSGSDEDDSSDDSESSGTHRLRGRGAYRYD